MRIVSKPECKSCVDCDTDLKSKLGPHRTEFFVLETLSYLCISYVRTHCLLIQMLENGEIFYQQFL